MATAQKQVTPKKKKSSTASAADKGSKRGTRSKRGGQNKTEAKEIDHRSRTFPEIREQIELDHAITRGTFDAHFNGFRSAFFLSASILGRFGLTDGSDRVHEYIIGLIDNATKEIRAEVVRIKKLIVERGGPENIPRSSPEIVKRKADVPSYVVRRYMMLFPEVDRLIDTIVCAENVGAISWNRRAKLLDLSKRYLRSPAGRFHSLSQKLVVRQRQNGKNIAAARKAMQEVLDAAIAEHAKLPGVEKKRPMQKAKTGT